jgi:hypothetical protein
MRNIKIRAFVAFQEKEPHKSIVNIIYNLVRNQFTVSETGDIQSILPYEDIAYRCYTFGKIPAFPITWYAWKNGIRMQIILNRSHERDSVTIYPINLSKTIKEQGSKNEEIDLTFYIQCALEICENFLVFELVSLCE